MAQSLHVPYVLVVDDDPFIRGFIVDILRDVGFEAHEAGCAEEALRGLGEHPEIDAVVTDVDMPGELNGIGLARRIGERWPRIGVIVISGGSSPVNSLPRAARFLAKPFTAARLLRAVAELAGDPAPARAAS